MFFLIKELYIGVLILTLKDSYWCPKSKWLWNSFRINSKFCKNSVSTSLTKFPPKKVIRNY